MCKFSLSCFASSTLLFSICLLQIGCSAGTTDSTSNLNNATQLVSLGSVTEIPLLPNTLAITAVSVNNNSGNNVELVSTNIQINGVTLNQQQQDNLVDVSNCKNITANTSCNVIITPPKLSGGFVINMIYTNNQGFKYKTSQLIKYSSHVSQTNGFVYFPPNVLPQFAGINTLSIPVILAENYSTLSVTTNQLPDATTSIICPDNNYLAGNMCTVIVRYPGSSSQSQSVQSQPQVVITGNLKNSQKQNFSIITLSLTRSNAGNLITSGLNTIINPTNSSTPTITLFNNGVGLVSGITINGITPVTIDQSGGCGSTLASGNSCTFKIGANSATISGQSQVLISYDNGLGETKILTFNVYYTPTIPMPNLSLLTNGWFVNTMVNSVAYQGVYVVNNGNVNLNNLQFSNINSQVSSMNDGGNGQTCINGQSLAPLASCIIVINYAPTSSIAVGNSININVLADYYDQGGNLLSYANTLNMQYSANDTTSGDFILAGDYGAISSSVTTPAGTWTVENNTPFTAAATSITRMVNNGKLQVIGTGGTAAGSGFIYTADKGMIWQSASGGTNAPPTGATNRAITGLTYDSTNGYLVTNNLGAGNLYSISTITGVTPTWNAVFNGAFVNPPFNLFNFGSSLAYLAPENTATSGQQLAVATSPNTSWTTVNPSGAARTYRYAIYDGNQYCVLSSTRFISCAASSGFTTLTPWIQNTTAISATGTANMLANNANISYVALLSTLPFVVFLTSPSNPSTAGTWTSAATRPSAALTWVAYGNGQYVGVSAASPGLIWTSESGNIWTQRTPGTANNPINAPYGFVYYDGNYYWASGTRVLKVSSDGVNWSNAGVYGLTYTYIGTSINYLAAGTAGAIESSSDLIAWDSESSTTNNKLNTIKCFNSNKCYAIGESGTILFSSDGAGTIWNSESSNTANNLNGIACGYSNCVVVGDNGAILTESIGSNIWVAESSGITQDLNSVTFYNAYNMYIAVGNSGYILISSDGINWTIVNSSGNNLNSVACAYSRVGCMAVGASGRVITSLSGIIWTAQASATATSNAVIFYNGYWIVSQAGAAKYSLDNSTTLTWNTINTGITNIAAMNLNTILAY